MVVNNDYIWGVPARHGNKPLFLDGLFQGKRQSKMDDDLGAPPILRNVHMCGTDWIFPGNGFQFCYGEGLSM